MSPPQPLGATHLAVDLGTSCIRVRGPHGTSFQGASVLAVEAGTGMTVAFGDPAKGLAGRTPPTIETIFPLRRGVVTDVDAAARLLGHALGEQRRGRLCSWLPLHAVAGVPVEATEVQLRAAEDAFHSAGVHSVRLVPKVTLAAIGAGVPVGDSTGTMVVDIGAGTTEVAVFAFGSLVAAQSLLTAGDTFGAVLRAYFHREHELILSARAAEAVKISFSRAAATGGTTPLRVRGQDRITGLPKTVTAPAAELMPVIAPEIERIAAAVIAVAGRCPVSLAEDVTGRGLVLTGGGALLSGLPEQLGQSTGMAVHLAGSPLTSAVEGAVRCATDTAQSLGRQPLASPMWPATPHSARPSPI